MNTSEIPLIRHIRTAKFGRAEIRKFYLHHETRELVADVKADTGEIMFLSMKYIKKLEEKEAALTRRY